MALPGITLPAALPPFLIAGHAAQWQSVFADIAMTTGHRRKRRVGTARPQIVNVSLILEADEMTAFHRWHRDTLRSGERHFAARVKEQGPGMLWYDAVWVDMYQAVAMHLGRWQVSGQLMVTGDGEVEGPALGGFVTAIDFGLSGTGGLNVGKNFSTEVVIALLAGDPES